MLHFFDVRFLKSVVQRMDRRSDVSNISETLPLEFVPLFSEPELKSAPIGHGDHSKHPS